MVSVDVKHHVYLLSYNYFIATRVVNRVDRQIGAVIRESFSD